MEDLNRKDVIISELLELGIYKKRNLQLFELSLYELEAEYNRVKGKDSLGEHMNSCT
ncbi:Fur-regulated basic protein FbpA [Mesobacillus harenae]|uniref:Fur-regulated basic protein FbpA n=1 Tax=Mesobacillus harenae TaxID=2213203 RepID=UPI001F555710|nr:Fur-regulated basic protein FbpA [Mesobacillus harenae]